MRKMGRLVRKYEIVGISLTRENIFNFLEGHEKQKSISMLPKTEFDSLLFQFYLEWYEPLSDMALSNNKTGTIFGIQIYDDSLPTYQYSNDEPMPSDVQYRYDMFHRFYEAKNLIPYSKSVISDILVQMRIEFLNFIDSIEL